MQKKNASETEVEQTGPGRGWHGDSERHRKAGQIGGAVVSQNRDHMSEIGRKGGAKTSQDREWMAEIGRRGGKARRLRQEADDEFENEHSIGQIHA